MTDQPLLAFYGDDFTGSADVVLQYQRLGLRGKIFLGAPSNDQLAEAAREYPVVGVAGTTRALPAAEIRAVIEPVFRALMALKPDFLQYKVCSTADSSASIGSFEPAIRLGRELCGATPVPILVAQPNLGRYTAFSNHFAVDRGTVYRLDRQPVMANHPVTPMPEADLRRHVELQLDEPVGAITVTELRDPDGGRASFAAAAREGLVGVVVDSLSEADLHSAGELFMHDRESTLFGLGSGGLSIAVARALGFTEGSVLPRLSPMAGPCLAVSGSCSPLTADQIRDALDSGWLGITLELSASLSDMLQAVHAAAAEALTALQQGRSVVIYSCGEEQPMAGSSVDVRDVATALASAIRYCAEHLQLERVIVAGGDTSGHVITALGATAMTSISPVGEFTLCCELEADSEAIDGLQVVLKGGQIGKADFFEFVRLGDGRLDD